MFFKLLNFKSMCWLGTWCILFLCIFIANGIKDGSSTSSSLDSSEIHPRPNHLGAFRTVHWDPDQKGKPAFAASFDSMSTENGKVVFFNTAIQRTVKINDFNVNFFRYSSESNKTNFGNDQSASMNDLFKGRFENFFSKDVGFSDKEKNYSINYHVDFSNISKLSIIDFKYNRFLDEEIEFSLKCKKAETCFDKSALVLRGHVIIKTGSGAKLETNHVIWNLQEETFQAKGIYFLNENGVLKKGKDVCLNMNLKEVQNPQNPQ